jgi:4-amino-4-deoxy-L-arabinose transferase-like glycosyltransferase
MVNKKLLEPVYKRPVVTLLAFGIVIRLLIMLLYQRVTFFPDSPGYTHLAELLYPLQLDGYTGERIPGYPLLITLAGNSLALTVLYQFIIGIATSIVFYKTLLSINFNKRAALLITIFLNSFLHVIFYETTIFTESLTLFFITLVFYLLFSSFFSAATNWKKLLLLCFVLGYLVLIKPFYIYLPFVIYGLYTLKNFTFRRIINNRIVILILPIFVFLGWSYVNKLNTGHFVSTTYWGINIAQNCVHFCDKVPSEYKLIGDIYKKHRERAIKENKDVAMSIWMARDELMEKTGLSLVELSAELSKYGKAAIKENPMGYTKQVLVSWKDFWLTGIHWHYHDYGFKYINKKVFLTIWYVQMLLLTLLKAIFVVMMPFIIIRFFKDKKITPQFVITIIIFATSVLQALATYGTNFRYSYPFEWYMVIVLLLTFKDRLMKIPLVKRNYKIVTAQ